MISEKIEDYCKKNGLSIRAFEARCDLPNGIVGKWKNGRAPSLSSIIKIAQGTKTSMRRWI